MADQYSERDEKVVNRQSDDEVRGIASDETDAEFDDSEDLDEEDESEEEDGGTF